jgi:hypothetical protein
MPVRHSLSAWTGLVLVLVGIAWLGPLMLDQMTFFGDRGQEADAAAARSLMGWPALLVGAGAAATAMSGRILHGAIAATPLIAVALAWATPAALYQLLAYGIASPIAAGSVLASSVPLAVPAPRPLVIAALATLAGLAILATPVLAGLAVLALLAWAGLSRDGTGVVTRDRR